MRDVPIGIRAKLGNQFQTIYNESDPRLLVSVARARTTVVDSTYWTVETIREGAGLGDVSVAPRRNRPYGAPNRIYNIYVQNGQVGTAIREYPDRLKDGWKDQFFLGAGTSVGIAFDGYWERYRKLWRLVTEEKPYLFWVDGSNKLQVQIWDESGTKRELASDVVKVKAMRSWKNVNYPEIDHGIIALYIKNDGKVYYRNYCYQENTQEYSWENEVEITEFRGTAVNVNLFMTNDYRTGVVIEDSSQNIHWLITNRNWAGMAIEAENLVISPTSLKIDVVPVAYYEPWNKEYLSIAPVSLGMYVLYADSFNEFLSVENIDDSQSNYGIYVTCSVKHEMFSLNKDDFELVDSIGVRFRGQSVQKINETDYKIEFEDFNNAFGEVSLVCKGNITTNAAGYLFDSFNIGFIPEDLEPDTTEPPEVDSIWNE